MVFALLLTISVMGANILETYRTLVDAFVGTRSQVTVISAEGKSTVEIFDAFTERGFEINPSMLAAYDVPHELSLDKFRNCQVFTAVSNSERKESHTNTFLRF